MAPTQTYHRGHKPAPPEVRAALHAAAFRRHDHRVARLSHATARQFDCRTAFGNVLPGDDQGNCGSCYMVSSFDGASMALVKAGYGKADGSFRLSSQFGLDCHSSWGGCDGGDEAQVIDWLKNNGAPLTSDYGPYNASPGRCKPIAGMTTYRLADWGYCTPSQQDGVASTQDMKNCMVQYGPLSVAFDAGGCDGYRWPQTMTGRGNNVDHAVLCIGWDDDHDNGDGSKGAFIGMNQWGDGWGGPGGTFWIKYGAWSWGTEAIWMSAAPLPPPPPGPPPGPTPPPVPVPQTFTASVPQQPVIIFGMNVGHVPAYTLTGTVGHGADLSLPSWWPQALRLLCGFVPALPDGAVKQIAGLLCGLVPATQGEPKKPCGCK